MPLIQSLFSRVLGTAKKPALNAAKTIARTPGLFMMGAGAAIGGVVGAVRGDNYDETSLFRNMAAGAVAGAAGGLLARGIFTRSTARGIGSFLGMRSGVPFRSSPIAKLGVTAGKGLMGGAKLGLGLGKFAANHPGLLLGAGAVVGGAYLMSPAFTQEQALSERFNLSDKDVERYSGSSAYSDLANSANGLSFGLHERRHG